MSQRDELVAAARRWLAADPDPATRAELSALLERDEEQELAGRFGARLTFGTAGIRGQMGGGPARMNRLVVRQVSAGLAAHVLADVGEAARRGVVVGCDARHNSSVFAADTAAVLAAAGLRVHRFAAPVPTPLVAYAVRALDAAAGVQITASHNPAADNGYKVYWEGGAQIVAPLDSAIAAAIDRVTDLAGVPLAPADDARVTTVADHVAEDYLRQALRQVDADGPRALRIVVTPLHGVAGDMITRLLGRAGFTDVHVVTEQSRPDPDFPTVAFPNPEEPGALDLALALAARVDADIVLANDPDGDRIAVAVPDGGRWRMLSGDEAGCVLAAHLLARGQGPDRTVATTVVSSQLLGRMAAAEGVAYAETLTGFKWLARAAAEAEAQGRPLVCAYEQALGIMVGTAVRDKDGITAALHFADLAAQRRADGSSVLAAVDELARRFGLHATAGRSVRLVGARRQAQVAAALARLRQRAPRDVDGVAVVALSDHAAGIRRTSDGTEETLPTPPADLFGLELADGSRLQVRPSGTEPLLKFYAEVVEPVDPTEPVQAARTRAGARLAALTGALVRAAGLAGS